MHKKTKMKLEDLKVQSFVTAERGVHERGGKPGGGATNDCPTTGAPICLASCDVEICGNTFGICF